MKSFPALWFRGLYRLTFILFLSTLPGILPGQTWEDITGRVPATLTSIPGAMTSDGERLFLLGGANGRGVLVSNDNGETFTALNEVAGTSYSLDDAGQVHGLGYANGRVWFMASSGDAGFHYLHSLEAGATVWEQAGVSGFPPPVQLGSFGAITDIVYVPESMRYFCIAELGGVYSSVDGRNWEKRSDGFDGMGAVASLETIDGTVFAIRPMSGGMHASSDDGQSWTVASPYTGIDGANLERIGDSLVFLVRGTNSATAYVGFEGGSDWFVEEGLPFGLQFTLNGDGERLYAHASFPTRLMFSATSGLSWKELPMEGIQLNAVGSDHIGVIEPEYYLRHGDNLYLMGKEVVSASFEKEPRLYRLDLSSVDLSAELRILRQPKGLTRVSGDRGTLSVVAVGEDLGYQWYRDGEAIAGATTSMLQLGPMEAGDAGEYTVVVSGSGGEETSSVAVVDVRAERIDGQYDPAHEPEVTDGGPILLLPDGDFIRVENNAGSGIERMDAEGNSLNWRRLTRSIRYEGFELMHHLIDSQGRLVAGGYVRGSDTASNQRLRRFDPVTLEDDPSFGDLSGFDSNITGLAELPGRGYLLTGQFERIGGVEVPRLVLVTYDGVVDPSYASDLTLTPHGVLVGDDGTVYIRGDFGGTPYRRMVRVDAGGRVMDGFGPVTDIVDFMHRLEDGRILLVTSRNGEYTPHVIGRDGSPDASFSATGTFDGTIRAATEQADGRLILAGEFTSYDGMPAAGHIRLLPDGSVDSSYDASEGFNGGTIISAIAVPGYVYFSNNGAQNRTFQGNPNSGGGPVRVFAGDPPPDIRPFLGGDFLDGGNGDFFTPILGWFNWDGADGLAYSYSLQRFVYLLLDREPIDSEQGFWMGIFHEGSFFWAFIQKRYWAPTPANSRNGYLYVNEGLSGAPGWFYYHSETNQFYPV